MALGRLRPENGIDVLQLQKRPYNLLSNVGILTIGQLVIESRESLENRLGFGPVSIGQIERRLADHGASLARQGEEGPEPPAQNPADRSLTGIMTNERRDAALLERSGIRTLGDLAGYTIADLCRLGVADYNIVHIGNHLPTIGLALKGRTIGSRPITKKLVHAYGRGLRTA